MRTALVLAAAIAFAGPAAAQDGWDVQSVPEVQMEIAGAAFDSGIALVFRCKAKWFEAILTGLPPVSSRYRRLDIAVGDHDFEGQGWQIGAEPTAAFSNDSARLARAARRGGTLSVRVPETADVPARVYQLGLPTDPAGLDAVMAACETPLVDEADAVQPARSTPGYPTIWLTRPAPMYPQRAFERGYREGRVELSCAVKPNGFLDNCQIVAETPARAGFGESAVTSAHQARLLLWDDVSVPGVPRVNFPVTFRLP